MGHRLRFIGRSFAAALVVLALAAGGVAAHTSPVAENFSFSRSGLSAEASSGECVNNPDGSTTCSGTGVFVFAGKTHNRGEGATRGTEVCAYAYSDTFNPQTGEGSNFSNEFGCTTDLGAGTSIARDLSIATIAPTTITIQGETCDETGCQPAGAPRDIVVEGTFTATTPVVREAYRSFRDDGVCVQRDSSRGSFREATFNGTIDNQPLMSGYSVIRSGSFSFSVKCAV